MRGRGEEEETGKMLGNGTISLFKLNKDTKINETPKFKKYETDKKLIKKNVVVSPSREKKNFYSTTTTMTDERESTIKRTTTTTTEAEGEGKIKKESISSTKKEKIIEKEYNEKCFVPEIYLNNKIIKELTCKYKDELLNLEKLKNENKKCHKLKIENENSNKDLNYIQNKKKTSRF